MSKKKIEVNVEPVITVNTETFEGREKRINEQKYEIGKWNVGIRGDNACQPTINEELNLNGDPNFQYIGKGSLY